MERQRRMLEEERRRSQPETPKEPLGTEGLEKPGGAPPDTSSIRFLLKRIEFSPSEILSKDELDKIAAEYQGKEVTFADLQALVAKVNALYREKGAVAAQAVIPPQDVSGGVVQIRLVEGRVGSYRIEGNESTADRYILSRLKAPVGSLLDTKQLERDLVWFNRTNGPQLRAELVPGAAFGTTDVMLKLTEPDRHNLQAFTDNAGSKSTGEMRTGGIYQNRSLLGYRDELTASYTAADGYQGESGIYSVPFNVWGGRVQLGFYNDETDVRHGAFAPLHLTGHSVAWIGTVRQPVYVTADARVDATLNYASRTIKTWINGVFLQRIDLADVYPGLDFSRYDAQGAWTGNLNVTDGRAKVPARETYTILRGGLRRDQDLPGKFQARLNISGQTTSNRNVLPGSEQFFIGGVGSVRGYSNLVYSGIDGYVANAELHHLLYGADPDQSFAGGASGFVFHDYGETRLIGPGLQPIRLQSVGAGVDLSLGRGVSGHVTFGYQLKPQPQEPGIYRIDFLVTTDIFPLMSEVAALYRASP